MTKFFSTHALEDAQLDYRALCLEAQREVRRQLKQLAASLAAHLPELVAAASTAIVCNALQRHVAVAISSGWTLPTQLVRCCVKKAVVLCEKGCGAVVHVDHVASWYNVEHVCLPSIPSTIPTPTIVYTPKSQRPSDGSPRQPMQVDGVWPYWLPAGTASTTVNSFCMDSMFILTGPNMAGKSTLLRATCALAVLSACGLYAPVRCVGGG